jgi:hypothetical protein
MDRPQQPELERSGHTPIDQEHRDDLGPAVPPPEKGRTRVPPANRPGHHPALEQDKPVWAGGAPPDDGDGNGASKADLYRAARRLGIRGRSRMTKRELADAVASHTG